MKYIPHVFITLTFLLFASSLKSQVIHGFRAGANFSILNVKEQRTRFKSNRLAGFKIAYTVERRFNDYISIETGLGFESKGGRAKDEGFGSGSSALHYLTLPLLVRGGYDIKNFRIVAFFGPYVSGGLFAYDSFDGEIDEVYVFDDESGLKPIDFGLTAGFGMEFKRFELLLEFPSGLLNIVRDSFGEKYRNRTITLSIGFKGKNWLGDDPGLPPK